MFDPNYWRGVIFTQAFFVFVMTAFIIVRYATKLLRAHDRALPLHIVTIALSYLLATVFITMEIAGRWDLPLSYRVPLSGAIFVLGDAGLVFMLIHISIQRKFIGQIRAHVTAEDQEEKKALAAELKRQTAGLASAIKKVGEQAEQAYNEANSVNSKIVDLHREIHAGQATQADQVVKIDSIDETGKDTNTRVREIEPVLKKKLTK